MKLIKQLRFIILFIVIVLVIVGVRAIKKNYFVLSVQELHASTLSEDMKLSVDDLNGVSKNDLLVDLREKNQFENSHLDGAVNVRFDDLLKKANLRLFKAKDRVIFYSGQVEQAVKAKSILNQLAFKNIYILQLPANADFSKKFKVDSLFVDDEVFKYKFQPDTSIKLE